MTRFGLAMVLAGTLLLASNSAGWAAPPAGKGPTVELPLDVDGTQATLDAIPSNDDMQRYYPKPARFMSLGGAATMTCKTLTSGQLQDCRIVSESPSGLGFGTATLQTARFFHVTPARINGVAVEGVITIPMRWAMDFAPPPAEENSPTAPMARLELARQIVTLRQTRDRLDAMASPLLRGLEQNLAISGDAAGGLKLENALRGGLEDVIAAEVDRRTRELAAGLSEADLRATLAFLQTPVGRAWSAVDLQSEEDRPKDLTPQIGAAARARYCAQQNCPTE